jgi:hypothetical protein
MAQYEGRRLLLWRLPQCRHHRCTVKCLRVTSPHRDCLVACRCLQESCGGCSRTTAFPAPAAR